VSAHALSTKDSAAAPERGRDFLGWADIAFLAAVLPVFIVADLPLLGYAACAGAWLLARGLHHLLTRAAARAESPRNVAGLLVLGMITRVWLVAVAILAAGLTDREAGLAGAVLAAALFQVYLIAVMITRTGEARR
jgi:hypothetical protein